MRSLLQWLEGILFCAHRRLSFPLTPKKAWKIPAALVTGTYQVCLECGEEFPYSWREMKIVSANKIHLVPSRERKEKVSV